MDENLIFILESRIQALEYENEELKTDIKELKIEVKELEDLLLTSEWTVPDYVSKSDAMENFSSYRWREEIVKKIIEYAEYMPMIIPKFYGSPRIKCPLCGGSVAGWSSDSPEGFAFPLGLERHLLNSRIVYKGYVCPILDAAIEYRTLRRDAAEEALNKTVQDMIRRAKLKKAKK